MSFASTVTSRISALSNNEEELSQFLLKAMPFIMQYSELNNRQQNSISDESRDDGEQHPPQCETVECEEEKHKQKKRQRQGSNDISHFILDHGTVMKGKVYRDFMKECMDVIEDEDRDDRNEEEQKCPECECATLTYITSEALKVCEQCGFTASYQDFGLPMYTNSVSFNGEIVSQFAYKRVNHFREWLTQIQGKENTTIPDDVILQIMKELKKERIFMIKNITHDKIKQFLKKNGLSKYYEHIPTIINKICRKDRVDISHDTEQLLVKKFCEIQEPFERHRPKNRKNFMSYSYTLHKLCQLIDRQDLTNVFPLLKSRAKLRVQDEIWEKICQDCGWEFIPSI